jgi:hypothetical protein
MSMCGWFSSVLFSGLDMTIEEYRNSRKPNKWVLESHAAASALGMGAMMIITGDIVHFSQVVVPRRQNLQDLDYHWVCSLWASFLSLK